MLEVIIHEKNNIRSFQIDKDELLLDVLRTHGYPVYSECAGNGTCGKCRVHIKGSGVVTSCLFKIQSSIEVVLPEQKEAQILSAQHSLTIDLPFDPGESVHLSSNPFGIAIDLGTTTLVFYLVSLKTGSLIEIRSMLNPQRLYGADVISRIYYASSNKSGTKLLQALICSAINIQIKHFCRINQAVQNDIVKIGVAGNNTMLHLLLGEDPSSMGQAPYIPRFIDMQKLRAGDAGLLCNPGAELSLLPSVSAFVGADIIAGLGSIRPLEKYRRFLFLDLGTNGELALVTPSTIWCCATAAGPAFEGANISCGMGGVDGAIAEYSANGFRVIGEEKPIGVCGSGLVDVVAYLFTNGYIDSSGYIDHDFEIIPSNLSGTGNSISLTQQDIREVQLAKSAITSGINILLRNANLTFDNLDALFLAGGFGNYMNVTSAMKIGLIPAKMKEKVISLGNTAGTGALISLRASSFDQVLADILRRAKHIELSEDENFAIEFALNMAF
jgi:uncharacterized 2Fe-2S/4Fe-4S cluster protein (DUF4445 family)